MIYDKMYGGSGSDYAQSPLNYENSLLKVVGNDVFILGGSNSPNFPVTNGSTLSGTYDNLYIKINATTGDISFATYFGGSDGTSNWGGVDLRVDNGGVYILGLVDDTDFPRN